MKTRNTKLAIASAVGTFVGLAATFATWRYPFGGDSKPPAPIRQNPPSSLPLTPPVKPPSLGEGAEVVAPPNLDPSGAVAKPSPPRSLDVVLAVGEQKRILDGQVGIALREQLIGLAQKPLLTIHISPSRGQPKKLPFTGAGGETVEFNQGDHAYVVSISQWDSGRKEAKLQINLIH